ncbi:hypothetical protein EV702DRAFT_980104, partial [Suillus placidus]
KLFREANVLYWAKALLGFVYDFINHAIADASDPPPFAIPQVRFVEAGLALSYSQGNSKSTLKTGTARTAFLLEEVIEGEDFTKFIHNMDPDPLLDPDQDGYDFALFLAFMQHIQYAKTGGLVYISDYQGNTSLLTDPQIMTHSSVSEGKDMFGGGNIEKAVNEFERRHVCNKFCKWPGFGLKTLGGGLAAVKALGEGLGVA